MSPTHHPPGTFCWAELATTDTAGAKSFYGRLFDWQTLDEALPSGGTLTMLEHQGGKVGALYELTQEMRVQGVPPAWLLYVTVEDAAATAARAVALGGTVIKDAFEVFDIGTMAVVEDPTGAVLAVWQPDRAHGTDHTDARPGTVCWNELATRDAETAGRFYSELFGWRRQVTQTGGGLYTLFMLGDKQVGGMLQMTDEWNDAPSHWMVYFSVADCDASAARAAELGGEVCVPPTEIPPAGRFAVISDPQGAYFSIIRLTDEEAEELRP